MERLLYKVIQMKKKQLSLCFVILSLLYVLTSCKITHKKLDITNLNEKDGLQLTISIDKTTYRSDEIMLAMIQLKNVNSNGKSILVCKWLYDWTELDFAIRDESGKRVNITYMVDVAGPEPFDFVTLIPGEAVEHIKDIHDPRKPLNPGKYTVQAIYKNRFDPDPGDYTDKVNVKSAWKGTLESNIVTITIKP
jgi:hypothetical protein